MIDYQQQYKRNLPVDLHNVPMYTQSLPICGISLIGDQIRGPSPYPATYKHRPRVAGTCATPNVPITSINPGV
jgi:hypothetical protein